MEEKAKEEFKLIAQVNITINTLNDRGRNVELRVAQLGTWQHCGDRSLITGDKTNANVIAEGKVMTLTLRLCQACSH